MSPTFEQCWVETEALEYMVLGSGTCAWMVPIEPKHKDEAKEPAPQPKELVE